MIGVLSATALSLIVATLLGPSSVHIVYKLSIYTINLVI